MVPIGRATLNVSRKSKTTETDALLAPVGGSWFCTTRVERAKRPESRTKVVRNTALLSITSLLISIEVFFRAP